MTYELAKQLKDAGFPESADWAMRDDDNKLYYDPGLPELIKSLPSEEEEICLYRFEPSRWKASYKNPSSYVLIGESDAEYEAFGDTPEEAVAKLWLKINKFIGD